MQALSGQPPQVHTKADETPAWWFQQIDDALAVAQEVEEKPKHYRRQLREIYDLQVPEMVVGVEENSDGERLDFPSVTQIDLLYLPRHKEWFKSNAYDAYPEVTFPRSGPNGNVLGEFQESLCERVGHDIDEIREYRQGSDYLLAYGCYVVWYGIHSHASDAATLVRAGLGAEEAVQMVAALAQDPEAPRYRAWPGQGHEALAAGLREKAEDPNILLEPQGAILQQALLEAADLHDAQGEKDAKRAKEHGVSRNEVWAQHSRVGVDTVWEANVDDFYDARFVARRMVFDIDVARHHPAFKPKIARGLVPGTFDAGKGYKGRRLAKEGEGADRVVSDRIEIWEVWDSKWRERHYIVRGEDDFLEVDAFDPNDGVVPGFFPLTYCAPIQSMKDDPTRPYGVPGAAIGYPIQRWIIKLASYDDEAVKKMSVRMTQSMGPLAPDVENAVAAGITGTNIEVPSEWAQAHPGIDYIRRLDFGNVPRDLFQRLQVAIVRLAELLAWPISQMTGQSQSSHATGDNIAMVAGTAQMGDMIREMQKAYAHGQRVKMALVKKWYTKRQLQELMPSKYFQPGVSQSGPAPSTYEIWQATRSEGDHVEAKFEPTFQNEDSVRRNQIREGLEFAVSIPGPAPGLPMYGPEQLQPMVRSYFRTLRLEAPVPTQYTPEQIAQARALALAGSQRGGQNKGEGKTKRDSSTASGQRPVSGKQSAGTQDVKR